MAPKKTQLMPQKINLCINLPTPITQLRRLPVSDEFGYLQRNNVQLFIKHDELNGNSLSGNKVRKLEYLLSDALQQGCDAVISCGAVQSNFNRAVCVAARQLGLKPILCVRGEQPKVFQGNAMINKWLGADIHYLSSEQFARRQEIMEQIQNDLISRNEIKKAYKLDIGGSMPLGIWGYIECSKEIAFQQLEQQFTHIVMAVGSGGTLAGMALGAKLNNLKAKIIGINVSETKEKFKVVVDQLIEQCIADYQIPLQLHQIDYQIIDGYVGQGYAIPFKEELKAMRILSEKEGILLDQVYSGKAFYGLLEEIRRHNLEYKNSKILFIHTGGLTGFLAAPEVLDLVEN